MRSLAIIILVSTWCCCLYAQGGDRDLKFRLGQSYDRSGDYESAARFYREALAKDSTNGVIIDALRRDLLQLKRYDEAIDLIEKSLRINQNDIGLLLQLGSAYAVKPDEPKALDVWNRVLATNPKNESVYRMVASTMMQSRMFEQAIAIYRRGRTTLNDPHIFAVDMAHLYSLMLNYREATGEYLNMIRQNSSQLGFVQSRIAMYTGRPEGLAAAMLVVEEAVKTDANTLSLHQLLAWVYMEGKKFDRAYDVYKMIDVRTSAGGREMYNFAERALKDRAFLAASKAFQDVITTYPKFDQAPLAKFGYARTLEQSDTAIDTLRLFGNNNPFTNHPESESSPLFTGAIAAYQRVVLEYPGTDIAARSLLRIAILKQEKFFDLDGARKTLEAITTVYARFVAMSTEATLRLGDIDLALGNVSEAEIHFRAIAGAGPALNEPQALGMLRLAEVDYFSLRFQEALAKLKGLATNAASDVANDAIALQIFIQENLKPTDAALKEFAKADLLKRQHKYSEALQRFESIVKTDSSADIVDETLMNIGDIVTQMNRFPDAITVYGRLLKDFPESIVRDKTLMKIGQVFQLGLKDKQKAIGAYQQLLEKYPNSIYTTEARRRVRELRGDTI